jgi:hypothetical protein
VNDQALSAGRAVTVTNHLDFGQNMVDYDKFISKGFGSASPHYPIDTETSNARNRRVELVLTRNDYVPEDTPLIVAKLTYDYMMVPAPGGPIDGREREPGEFARDQQIRNRIFEKYNVDPDIFRGPAEVRGEFGPSIPGIPNVSEIIAASTGSGENDSGAEAYPEE